MKAIAKLRILGLAAVLSADLPLGAAAQAPAAPAAAAAPAAFTAAQLEQMTAPIALYPDSLVTQILMGATYPLEIVEAARWSQANPGIKGADLEAALMKQDWDPAVKALCGFSDVLKRMNENLDWTQDLGDAFLAQKSDVLDSVQRMRGKAYEAGNLKTTEQQVVTQQPDKIIVIQPADPQVIYVPTYAPTVVYGAWHYPSYYYPAMYMPPPPGYGAMAFATGVMWGAALSGGCNWGWGHSDVNIDVDHYNNFNKNTNINAGNTNIKNVSGNNGQWNHNPEHRGGVNYKNGQTAQKYGAQGGSNRVTSTQARGYGSGSTQSANSAGQQRSAGAASGAATASNNQRATSSNQRATSATSSGAQRAAPSASASRSGSGGRSSAWGGSSSPSFDRSASSRGGASRSGGGGGGRRR